jgi:hypothetical protein
MSYYGYGSQSQANPAPPHGPTCACDVCAPKRLQNVERLSSTDRLAWLEKNIIRIDDLLRKMEKGKSNMGVALWCQTGDHSFDGNDKNAKRVTTDEYDENGKPTGQEVTVHICSRHAADMFKPKPRSLREIQQELNEATEIGD